MALFRCVALAAAFLALLAGIAGVHGESRARVLAASGARSSRSLAQPSECYCNSWSSTAPFGAASYHLRISPPGADYRGRRNTTATGRPCVPWAEVYGAACAAYSSVDDRRRRALIHIRPDPLARHVRTAGAFAEGPADEHNLCRSPFMGDTNMLTGAGTEGPWCFVRVEEGSAEAAAANDRQPLLPHVLAAGNLNKEERETLEHYNPVIPGFRREACGVPPCALPAERCMRPARPAGAPTTGVLLANGGMELWELPTKANNIGYNYVSGYSQRWVKHWEICGAGNYVNLQDYYEFIAEHERTHGQPMPATIYHRADACERVNRDLDHNIEGSAPYADKYNPDNVYLGRMATVKRHHPGADGEAGTSAALVSVTGGVKSGAVLRSRLGVAASLLAGVRYEASARVACAPNAPVSTVRASLALTSLPPMPSVDKPYRNLASRRCGSNYFEKPLHHFVEGGGTEHGLAAAAVVLNCGTESGVIDWAEVRFEIEPTVAERSLQVQVGVLPLTGGDNNTAAAVLIDDVRLAEAAIDASAPATSSAEACDASHVCAAEPIAFADRVREEGGVPWGAEQMSAASQLGIESIQCRAPGSVDADLLAPSQCPFLATSVMPHLGSPEVKQKLRDLTDAELSARFGWDDPAVRAENATSARAVELVRSHLPAMWESGVLQLMLSRRYGEMIKHPFKDGQLVYPGVDSDPLAEIQRFVELMTTDRRADMQYEYDCTINESLRPAACFITAIFSHYVYCVLMPELQTLRGWQDQIAGWRDLVTYSGSVDMQGMMRVMAQLKQSEIGTATGTINGLPPCTEALNELHSVMTNDGAAPGCSLLLNAMGMYALLPVLFMTRSNRNSPEPVCFESFFDIDWSTAQVHVGIISSPNPHHPPGPPPDPPSPLPTPPSQPPPSPTPSPTPPPPLLDYSLKQAREIGIATGLFLLAGAIAAAAGLAVRARRRRSTTPSSYTFLSPSAAIEEHGLWWVPSRETLDEWLPRLSQGTSDSIYSFDMRSLPPPRDGSSSGDSGSATDGYSLSKASSSSGDSSSKPLAEGEGSVGSDGSRSRDGDMRLRVVTSKSRPWMVGRGGEGDVYLALVERGARNLFTGYEGQIALAAVKLRREKRDDSEWPIGSENPFYAHIRRCNECRNGLKIVGISMLGGLDALVSPYFPHGDLLKSMRKKVLALSPERIESILLALAEFVSDFHQQRSLHRDIKPSNLLLRCACQDAPVQWATGLRKHAERVASSDDAIPDGVKTLDSISSLNYSDSHTGSGSSQASSMERGKAGIRAECASEELRVLKGTCDCVRDARRPISITVCDLSLAREINPALTTAFTTSSNRLAGTIAYIAPERLIKCTETITTRQAKDGGEGGEDNEPSTQREDLEARQGAKDVWAIGAVGWELLHYYETGRFSPLVSNLVGEGGAVGTPLAGIALLTQGVHPPPAPGGPELARVRDIVDAALAIDPDRRPTAAQIEASLRSLPSAKEPA